MKKIVLTEEEQQLIKKLYTQGFGYKKITPYVPPYSTTVIYRFLKEEGLIDHHRNVRKNFFNEDFFDNIDTEEKAYWLGYLFADGNINKRTTSITCHPQDKKHLQKLQKSLNSQTSPKTYKQNSFGTDTEIVKFNFYSIKMVNSLRNLGCIERKSTILQPPSCDKIPKELVNHFLRGYFDGDGSVSIVKNQTKKSTNSYVWHVHICGTKQFLEWYKNQLKLDNAITQDSRSCDSYTLSLGGTIKVYEKFFLPLYNNATIFLPRKYSKFEQLKNKLTSPFNE